MRNAAGPESTGPAQASVEGAGLTNDRAWRDAFDAHAWSLVGLLSGLLGLALASWWFWGSYFQVDVFASLSFVGDDGWCIRDSEAVGVHCFGDYAAIRIESLTAPLAGPEGVYPPSTRLLRIVPWLMDNVFGFRAGLILFLIASAAASLVPAYWASSRLPISLRPVVILTLGVATVPFISLIDRGQLLALAVPSLFLFMLASSRNHPWLALLALVPAVATKPQFALVLTLFAVIRQWRPFLVGVVGAVLIVLGPFALFGRDFVPALLEWIENSSSWAQSVPLTLGWPSNLSFPSTIRKTVDMGLNGPLGGLLGERRETIVAVPDSMYAFAMVAIGVVIVALLVLFGRHLNRMLVIAALLAVASFTLSVSWIYYACIALPIAAIIFRSPAKQDSIRNEGWWTQSTKVMLVVSVVLSLTPILVPLSIAAGQAVPNAMAPITSLSWLIFVVLTAIAALRCRLMSHGARALGES